MHARNEESEQLYARCAGCGCPVRLGPTPNWSNRVAWAEETINGRTRYWCRPCAQSPSPSSSAAASILPRL